MSKPLFLLYGKYEKKLNQPLPYKKMLKELDLYFKNNTKYNIYSLAGHFKMSKHRFTTNYIKSKDEKVREVIAAALDAITAHAMENEELYSRTLRYILAQAETGKAFIELDEKVLQSEAKVLVLPEKNIN